MDFYNSSDSYEIRMKQSFNNNDENHMRIPDDRFNTIRFSKESYEGIQIKEQQIVKSLTETHPAFTVKYPIRKPEKFSSLSAEERWNFSQKLKELQKIINAIQTEINPDISSSGFTLEEVLEVLNVRRAMQKGYDK